MREKVREREREREGGREGGREGEIERGEWEGERTKSKQFRTKDLLYK